jgi:hypothetical protein
MPYNPNANWTARTNAAAKAPVYYVAFEGLTTKHFSTAPVRSAGTTKKLLLKVPDSIAQKLFQLQGRASLNLITFELLDRDGEITDLIATEKSSPVFPTLINRAVTLYAGYADLNESDYAIVAVGQVNDVAMTDNGLAVKFTLLDLKRHQFDDLFRNADAGGTAFNSILSADATAGEASITVPGVGELSEGDSIYLGPSTHASYLGQEEKVRVRSVSGNRIHFGAENPAGLTKSFKAGDEVRWATTVLEGNPINLIYALLTGDFANGTFPITKKRGEPTGLGISAASIDTVALLKERDRMISADVRRFEIKSPAPGFRFLEQQIYRLLGYPVATIDGKLSFRLYRPAWPDDAAAGLPTITKSDVLRWRFRRAHELHVNKVVLGVDLDPSSGDPAQEVTTEDTGDQTSTKEIAVFDAKDTGLRASLSGVRLAQTAGSVFSRRCLKPPPQYDIWCPLTKRALQIGEVVLFSHDEIPNMKTGMRGLTNVRLEIVEREERFADGEVRFLLQDANFTRPAFVGPTGAITGYDSATAAEREFAYVGPAGFPVPNFDDGTPPYEVI